MQYQSHQLDSLFKQSFGNEQRLSLAYRAGCYGCTEIFATSDIVSWLEDQPIRTARCPRCGLDSVVAESREFALTPELIKQMQTAYCPSQAAWQDIDVDSFGSIEEIRAELGRRGVKVMVV